MMKKVLFVFIFTLVSASIFTFSDHLTTTAEAKAKCRVSGLNWKGSHPTLKQGLCDLSRALGPVIITNSRKHANCRTRADRTGKRNSWHKYHRGCRAADIRVRGVSPNRVKRWWLNYTAKKPYVGGASIYGSGFVHVDTRTEGARSW